MSDRQSAIRRVKQTALLLRHGNIGDRVPLGWLVEAQCSMAEAGVPAGHRVEDREQVPHAGTDGELPWHPRCMVFRWQ